MPFTNEEINHVYDKTDGYCYYCGKKISFVNYGKPGNHSAWEINPSKPVSRGGTNYLRNLVPACIVCNRDKSNRHDIHYKHNFEHETMGGWLY